jgi:glucose-6-phosphate isomerase
LKYLTKQELAELELHAQHVLTSEISDQIKDTGGRERLHLKIAGLSIDHSRQLVNDSTLDILLNLYKQSKTEKIKADYLKGEPVNLTENLASLHMAMRDGMPAIDQQLKQQITSNRGLYLKFAERVRSGVIRSYNNKIFTDIVHIGIGGSHLGQELAVEGLKDGRDSGPNIHFLSNIDSRPLIDLLRQLKPETTLFLIASKSFSTTETKVNSLRAKSWFLERVAEEDAIKNHFSALTSNPRAAVEFGIPEKMVFTFMPEIGGRFSVWSSAGLPIALSIGSKKYLEFLEGARAVDEHFVNQDGLSNIPLLTALVGVWNYNFLHCQSLAILCYDQRLRLLPPYLQQLFMECNGKSVTRSGEECEYSTMPVVWGGQGTEGQHAYHQLLHQGTSAFAADFIAITDKKDPIAEHRNWLNAHARAQSRVMSEGWNQKSDYESFKNIRGHHPHTNIVIDQLGASELGSLLSYYEHIAFYLGALWDINSFDQWGVERGKTIADSIFKELNK